ncbi:type IX secretion system membrane protein PorP/SprF [Aquimarina sp. AD10]|uniref:PorP/SprF family type IX secretion system membrane protein n=1 Tax=Aquimarina sp. AD10 TaxID=1714849 RepID=UPI000E50A986|nr:type IX secretion system membrane protein PorP/SprF [Aquimarina sp. AD10]AXT61167.1 type IX secretion system membrane protein PorP/SprF [Aquimarina sp. AD10]RKN02217.1 type IX secretion system membrane protein PorP/SprF [Aquimarina sp. AD10]
MNLKTTYVVVLLLFSRIVFAQEGIPVFADYLSDNLYLVHPAMAGAANANKIRLTARKQWFNVDDAPNLQTLNMSTRIGEKTGLGGIVFKDENGRFSQTGVYVTFAYHLLFSRDRSDLNMLSFGVSGGFIQSNVDLRGLDDPSDPDPVILDRVQKDSYYNMDVGMSYNYLEWYAHFTVKNILPTTRDIFNNDTPITESNNQRRYIFSLGRFFNLRGGPWSVEPSVMYQATDQTKESTIDVNAKLYREFEVATLWGGLSYRRSLDGAEFSQDGFLVENQQLQYITPFLGVNYKQWMVGYTYSYQSNSVVLSNGGFHQLTLGYDFGKRKERWNCDCPAVNSKN